MTGTILDVVNCTSLWLLIVDVGHRIAEQAIEPGYLRDILETEGLASPYDLEGREVELADDGLTIGLH